MTRPQREFLGLPVGGQLFVAWVLTGALAALVALPIGGWNAAGWSAFVVYSLGVGVIKATLILNWLNKPRDADDVAAASSRGTEQKAFASSGGDAS